MDIKNYLLGLLILALTAFAGWYLKSRKASWLAQLTGLIQQIELSVQGSNMGAEKKRLLIRMLEAANVHVTTWMSNTIDLIVEKLNEKNLWLTEFAGNGLSESTVAGADSGTES